HARRWRLNVADLLGRPSTDRVATTCELMRVVRVQTLHPVGRTATDAAGTLELVQRVATPAIVGVGSEQFVRKSGVVTHLFGELTHHTAGFEPSDGLRRAATREPVQGRERLAVDQRERFDHGREAATA